MPACPTDGDLQAIITTFTYCGCFVDNNGDIWKILSHTGITGAHTVPIVTPGTAAWQTVIGTVEFQKYSDLCVTVDGAPFDVDVVIDIQCDPSTAPDTLSVRIDHVGGAGTPATSPMYITGAGSCPCGFGNVMANGTSCIGNNAAIVGTVEVNRP